MMDSVQLIVECTLDEDREKMISGLGTVKYKLPIINSYVIELNNQSDISKLSGLNGIKAVYQTTMITAQMDNARKTVKADIAYGMGYTGRGVGIAILDTGVSPVDDLLLPKNRIAAFVDMVNKKNDPYDDNGHGTHVPVIVFKLHNSIKTSN